DEAPDVVGHVEELDPLLLVERHREAAHAVDRHRALFADLERDALAGARLERLVFLLQLLQLSLQLFFGGHGEPSRGQLGRAGEPGSTRMTGYAEATLPRSAMLRERFEERRRSRERSVR